ncbi:MAG: Bbp19 family protein [Candidatus Heimdallarchaeaceae archaeon]
MATKKSPYKQVDKVKYYKQAFGTAAGKEVLNYLIAATGMLTTSFDTDPIQMAFNEGQRNVVLHILNQLKMDPIKLRQFIEERENE